MRGLTVRGLTLRGLTLRAPAGARPTPSVIVLCSGVAAGLATGLVYGATHGLPSGLFLLALGAPVLAASRLAIRHRHRFGAPSRQLAVGVGLAVGFALAGVEAIALVPFVSPADAVTMGLLLAFAGVLVAYCAWLMTSRVADDVRALREGERMRRDLVAAVSHDLRTPVSSMRLLVDGVRDGVVEVRSVRGLLDSLDAHIHSLDVLVSDLFELSRIELGDVQWPREPLEMGALVDEAVTGMWPRTSARSLTVEVEGARVAGPVLGNPEKLQRVIFNLIENAIGHTPQGGTIAVRAANVDGFVEVEVADTGNGIAELDRDRVFEPLFRGGPDAARTLDGAGLGLPICRAIVEAHGGRIWLPAAAKGTRVRFSVPRCEEPAVVAAPPSTASMASTEQTTAPDVARPTS